MAVQKQDDQYEHTFSNYVRIRDMAQKTCLRRWTIGKSGERGSGISVLPARHDDDDDDKSTYLFYSNQMSWLDITFLFYYYFTLTEFLQLSSFREVAYFYSAESLGSMSLFIHLYFYGQGLISFTFRAITISVNGRSRIIPWSNWNELCVRFHVVFRYCKSPEYKWLCSLWLGECVIDSWFRLL